MKKKETEVVIIAISHPGNVLNGQTLAKTNLLVNVIVIIMATEDAIGLILGTLIHANVSMQKDSAQSLATTMKSLTVTNVSAKLYRNVIGRNASMTSMSLISRVRIVNVLLCAIVKIICL